MNANRHPCPSPILRAEALEDSDVDAAFPVVCAGLPIDLERWRSFIGARRAEGGDILALTAQESGPLGVLSWFARSDLLRGSSLVVDNLIVFELRPGCPGQWTLVEAAEATARRLRCGAIEVQARLRSEPQGWRARGWSVDPQRFCKELENSAAAGTG